MSYIKDGGESLSQLSKKQFVSLEKVDPLPLQDVVFLFCLFESSKNSIPVEG